MLLPSKHVLSPPYSRPNAALSTSTTSGAASGTVDHASLGASEHDNCTSPTPDLPRFQVFVPPFRFALVEQGVYRGGYPRPRNLPWLHQLKFRTLVSLTPDPLPDSIPAALAQSATSTVQCLHIHVPKPKEDQVPLDAALALKLITTLILDPARHPMYIHCLDGQLVTGTLIMALRKVQGWSVQSAIAEFQRCIRGESVPSEIAEFIQKLGGELDWCMPGARSVQALSAVVTKGVPNEDVGETDASAAAATPEPSPSSYLAPLPKWFWGGSVPFRKHPHSSLKLKLPPIVPCPLPHILSLVGPLDTPDQSAVAPSTPATLAGSSPASAPTPAALVRGSSSNAHDAATTPVSQQMQAQQQPSAAATGAATATPSQALKEIKARLLTDMLLGTPTSSTSSGGGDATSVSTSAGSGAISGLGILMAAAAASSSAASGGGSGGSASGTGAGGVGGASGAGLAVGAVHQDSDDALLDDLDDADDDEDVDGDGDEVNLSRMVQALNLEGLSG